jgi:uncharacterized protein
MTFRPLALAALLLLAAATALPALPAVSAVDQRASATASVTALAVEETDHGYVGTSAHVEAQVLDAGTGRIYVSTKPLAQTDMQGSARLAAQVAAFTLGKDWTKFDWLVSFESGSTLIGGPSAGADMTTAFTVALHNLVAPTDPWTLDPRVAATGTINPDGTIGPVGGVPAKAEGAKAAGITTFLFPAGLEQAPNLQATSGGTQTVVVDMAQKCASLGITCRSAATLADVLEAAVHVKLDRPAVAVPSTADYAKLLRPGVQADVDTLAARLAATKAVALTGGSLAQHAQEVQAQRDGAQAALDAAKSDLAAGKYYLAASDAFRGSIAAARAENLTAFYKANRDESVVQHALALCTSAVENASAVNDLVATDLDGLYAVGAGQQRVAEAGNLRDQAQQQYQQASTFNDWVASLSSSTFCTERAKTAVYWAGLKDVFPAGPQVSAEAVGRDILEQATDLVSYAQAVLSNRATDAASKLTAAQAQADAGRWAAAALDAAEAHALASVAVQTGGGSDVPASVLAAAQDGTARAIQSARAVGAEPMVSVSLVELSASQADGPTQLQELWTARNLALLEAHPVAPATTNVAAQPSGGDDAVGAALGIGLAVGFAAAGVLVVVAFLRR